MHLNSVYTINKYNNGFIRDVSVLTSGTAIAQIFPFLLYPLIGRIYTPEDNAVLALYSSIVSIVQVLSTGMYEGTIFLADNDRNAANLAALSFTLCFLVCILTTIVFFFFPNITSYFSGVDIGPMKWLIPLSVISITVFNIYNQWCVRRKYFGKLSINKISNSAFVNGGKVMFGFTSIAHYGLVIGDVLGRIITMLICIIRMGWTDYKTFRQVTLSGIKRQAIVFSMFPKFSLPAQFLNTLGGSVPILLLSKYYSENSIGQYSMSYVILCVPTIIIARSIRDVFRKKVNDTVGKSSVRIIFIRLFKKAVVLSFVVAVLAIWFLPGIFSIALGEQWRNSGVYSQYLTPMIVVNFISVCVDAPVLVAKKMKQSLAWQVLYCAFAILPPIISIALSFDFITFIILVVCFKIVVDSTFIVMSYYYACWLDKHSGIVG